MAEPQQPTLVRAVSRWQVVAFSVNDVIGSGVYLLPAVSAQHLGDAALWGFLGAGLAALLIVLCFAEAGSMFDTPGAGLVYTREAFGPFVGFSVGWMTWIARVTVAASLSVGLAQATSAIWPAAGHGWGRALMVAGPLLLLTWINVAGVQHGARTAVVLTIGKLVPLVALVAVGLFAMDWSRVHPATPPPANGIGDAALLLLFAYAGFENTAAPAGEYTNPRRDVPFALLVMMGSVTAIYTLIQLVAIGLVPGLAGSLTPLADAAALVMGPFGVWLLTIGAVLSIAGTNNNTVLAGSRYLYALAETGRLPRVLAGIHPRARTPWIAILTQTAIALPLALTGSFIELAALSIIARMATYMGTAAAVIVLRRKRPATERTVRLPGGPLVPIAALAVCLVFLSSATTRSLVSGAIALAVGAVIYLFDVGGKRGTR
ncbi:MAG TPA: APC family permease [Kofleriaceae bacterium]|nr:APC family permease [Kofleriaceae bacterium]